MPILLVTLSGNLLFITHTVKMGVFDSPKAPRESDRILDAVRGAISVSEAALCHQQEMEILRVREATLTGRERQVMTLVVTGLLNKQVDHELGISEITVKAQRGNVMRKMKARSAVELVKVAARLAAATGRDAARASR